MADEKGNSEIGIVYSDSCHFFKLRGYNGNEKHQNQSAQFAFQDGAEWKGGDANPAPSDFGA